jgi:ribosomal protein L20
MVIEDKEQSKQRFLEYWHDRVNAYKQQHNMVRSSLQSDLDSNQR